MGAEPNAAPGTCPCTLLFVWTSALVIVQSDIDHYHVGVKLGGLSGHFERSVASS